MNCEIMLADEAGDSPVEERMVAAPSVTLEMMAAVIDTVGSGSEVETLLPALPDELSHPNLTASKDHMYRKKHLLRR